MKHENMVDLDRIRAFFKADRYAMFTGIKIDVATDGSACCSLEILDFHLNAGDTVQGGVTFTLADFAFAVAANSMDICTQNTASTVSLSNNITFLRPPKGHRLIASARLVSKGKTVSLYQVTVTDDVGTLTAEMTVSGFTKKAPSTTTLEG